MPEEHPQLPKPNKQNSSGPLKRHAWWIIGGVAFLVLIAIWVFYLRKSNNEKPPATENPLNDIREAFPPTTTPATSTPELVTPPETSTPPTGTISPTPNTATPPPAPTVFAYHNPTLGFAFNLHPSWTVDENRSTPNSVAFISNELRQQGFVEVYPNTSGETLASLEATLLGSPSVTSVTQTTIAGKPALFFRGTTLPQNGTVILHKDKIYYLRGNLTDPEITKSFILL